VKRQKSRPRRIKTSQYSVLCLGLLLSAAAMAAEPADAADKSTGQGLVIGWSQRGISGSDWWKTMVAGGHAEADKLGANLKVLDANGDTTTQNEDIQTLITEGADVVIINANDPIGVAASIKSLKRAGIPVVAVNSNLDAKLVPDIFCYVAENQFETGALAGRAIAEDALKKLGDHTMIKLASIGGFPGDVISDLRFNGFMSGYNAVMSSHPGVKTTVIPMKFGEWKPDKALEPIRDLATANPDLKILDSESDVMLGGIVQGLKEAGLWNKGILIGSYDGGMNGIKEMVDDPDGPLQADASNQPWDQAVLAVKMAVAAYDKDPKACPSKTNYVPTTLVTPANAKTFYNPHETYVRAGG
jgi:ribose transport system substrate-binding protein